MTHPTHSDTLRNSAAQPENSPGPSRVQQLAWRAMLGAATAAGGAVVTLGLKWAVTSM